MTMSTASFDYLRDWLRKQSGIALDQTKRYLIEARLTPLVEARQLGSIDALVQHLRAEPGTLQQQLLNALVTTESSFFRDIAVFNGIRNTLLPDLLARRASERRLDIWCAACASGQEVYSLAILLTGFPQLASWTVRLVATDLSTDMLERARRGKFTQLEVNRGLPAKYLVSCFRQVGDEWIIDDRYRRMIEFHQLNLISLWPALGTMDLILMRNVLVYLDAPTRQAVIRKTHKRLRPNGYLVLGATETVLDMDDVYERVPLSGASAYRAKAS